MKSDGSTLNARIAEYRHRVLALLKEDNLDEAAQLLMDLSVVDDEKLLGISLSAAKNLVEFAPMLTRTGKFQEIVRLMSVAIQVLRDDASATPLDQMIAAYNLAEVFRVAGQAEFRWQWLSEAFGLAKQINEPVSRNSLPMFFELGDVLEKSGKLTEALLLYRHVHRYFTEHADIDSGTAFSWVFKYGEKLIAARQYDQVRSVYESALSKADNLGEAGLELKITLLGGLGGLCIAEGNYQKAEDHLVRARKLVDALNSKNNAAVIVYFYLANLYLDQKATEKYGEAKSYAEKSAGIIAELSSAESAQYAEAISLLAKIERRMNDLDAAENHYRLSIEVFERLPGTNLSQLAQLRAELGFVCLQRHRFKDSIEIFSSILNFVESQPKQSEILLEDALSNLATARFEMGDLHEAKRLYLRACRLRVANIIQTASQQ